MKRRANIMGLGAPCLSDVWRRILVPICARTDISASTNQATILNATAR